MDQFMANHYIYIYVDTCTLCCTRGMVCYTSHDWLNASKDPYNYCIQGTHNCNGSQWKGECKRYWHGYLLSSCLEVFINLMCRSKAVWVSSCVNLLHDQLRIDSIDWLLHQGGKRRTHIPPLPTPENCSGHPAGECSRSAWHLPTQRHWPNFY